MILLIIFTLGALYTIFFVPKRISKIELYTTSLFATLMGTFADMFLDVKLDLYGFFLKGVDWEYILVILFIYPAANILFLNYYPETKPRIGKGLYVIGFSLVTLVIELISLQTEVFYHNGWKIWHSAIAYPFLYTILRLNYLMIKRGFREQYSNLKKSRAPGCDKM
ncbi:CBO0543 family protein [Bacillus marasmi]|uniref:CBO0543 family protein n=1 Tax=Bacillus marasmi TaxID=1926279 RepID=UPI0011C7193A|nr:CBO0543 family protein [Bacillus marasmi]